MPALDLPVDARISPGAFALPLAPNADWKPTTIVFPATIVFPLDIQLGGLLDQDLFFHKPLPVKLYKSDGSYVAECSQLHQFGYGSDAADALDDLGKTLSEMYFYLSDSKCAERLSESLSEQYDVLCGFIGRRDVAAPKAS